MANKYIWCVEIYVFDVHVQLGYTLKNMKLTIYFSKKEEECRSKNRLKARSECYKVMANYITGQDIVQG